MAFSTYVREVVTIANELRHGTVGTELSQAEWESVTGHSFASQATGDIAYASSATQLSRLGIGATDTVLRVVAGIPGWSADRPAQATQAALEAETNEDTYAPPDLIKHSPGVAKAWCIISDTGALAVPDYNIASVGDTGVGDRDINFTVAFANADYAIEFTFLGVSPSTGDYTEFSSRSTSDVQLRCRDNLNALKDVSTSQAFHGDQ